jgi:glyoxylase-like metal-dependent hydrolase (beta-lactamase superfamily II)
MQFGKFNIDVIDTGNFALDGGAMFGVVPKPMWSKAYNQGDELNRIPLSARPLLVRFDDHIILVDSGNGTKMNEKFQSIYGIDIVKSNLTQCLEKFDVKPEEVTHFIYTHLHFDHAGGSTIIRNGGAQPLFTKAKHYVQKDHFNWALNPKLKDRASFILNDFMPIKDSGLLEFTDGEGEILKGISVIPVDGHTKAMQMVKLQDGNNTLLYCADLSPTSAHIKPPFVLGYDNFPLTTIDEKLKYFSQASDENWLLCFEHDAFTQAAYINENNKSFEIKEKVTIT